MNHLLGFLLGNSCKIFRGACENSSLESAKTSVSRWSENDEIAFAAQSCFAFFTPSILMLVRLSSGGRYEIGPNRLPEWPVSDIGV